MSVDVMRCAPEVGIYPLYAQGDDNFVIAKEEGAFTGTRAEFARAQVGTVAAFAGARPRTLASRFTPLFQSIVDYEDEDEAAQTDGLTLLNAAIAGASAVAMRTGQRVYLTTCGRAINIGNGTICLKSGVDLDLFGSVITHEAISETQHGSLAVKGENIRNFSVTGGEFHGPGTRKLSNGTIVKSTAYAMQLINCTGFVFETTYSNGNSGLLMRNCTDGSGIVHGQEIMGNAVGLQGGRDLTMAGTVRNGGNFCLYGTNRASNIRVLFAEKWMDDDHLNEFDHPGLWARRRWSHKAPLNLVNNAVWASTNGGQLTVSLQHNAAIDYLNPVTGKLLVPRLVAGRKVRLSNIQSTPAAAFHGDFEIVSVTATNGGTTSDLVLKFPAASNPGTYAAPVAPQTPGLVADLFNTITTLGLEACGATFDCQYWTVERLISRRSADAGGSFTGDFMTIIKAEVYDGHLGGITLSGFGSTVLDLKSNYGGHWNTRVAWFGGVAGQLHPAAGNVVKSSSFVKIVSIGDIGAPWRIDNAWRYPLFLPGAECGRTYCMAESLDANTYDIFRSEGEAPEVFGSVSPAEAGWGRPSDENDGEESVWNDGVGGTGTNWIWVRKYIGQITPPQPENNQIHEFHYDGPGAQDGIDNVGGDYNNRYPSSKRPFAKPSTLLNGEHQYWTGAQTANLVAGSGWANGLATVNLASALSVAAGQVFEVTLSGNTPAAWNVTVLATAVDGDTFTFPMTADPGVLTVLGGVSSPRVLLSSTPQTPSGAWAVARSAGNATAARVPGDLYDYALELRRNAGSSAAGSLFVSQVIEGSRLKALKNKTVTFKGRVIAGAGCSDNNLQFSWDIAYLTAPAALDNDLRPASAVPLSNGAVTMTNAWGDYEVTSTVQVPDNAVALIYRRYFTPALGQLRSATVVTRGTGYTSAPTVVFGGGGSNVKKVWPTAQAVISDGKVKSITILTRGSNIEAPLTITLVGGTTGTVATATAGVPLASDSDDYIRFEGDCAGPSDRFFSFEREDVEITKLRLGV